MKARQPQVRFVAKGHKYFAGGIEFSSVSRVLALSSLTDTQWMPPEAAQRGTAAHSSIAKAILGQDDPDYHLYEPYVSGALEFLRVSGIQVTSVEQVVADYTRRIAGTADIIGKKPDGTQVVVDWKTGGMHSWYPVQVAAYKIMSLSASGMIVQLTDKGKFKLVTHYKKQSLNWVYWDNIWRSAADLEHFRWSIKER